MPTIIYLFGNVDHLKFEIDKIVLKGKILFNGNRSYLMKLMIKFI